jgi:hypothetical protein
MVFFLDLDEPILLGRAFSPSEERTMTSGTFNPGVEGFVWVIYLDERVRVAGMVQ